MKLKKLILPMMAIIFAIGLTFATVDSEPIISDPNNDYIQLDEDTWFRIDEQDCGEGNEDCEAQLTPGGEIYQVYDARNTSTPKVGDGTLIKLY